MVLKHEKILPGSDIKKENWLLEFRESSAAGRLQSFLKRWSPESSWIRGHDWVRGHARRWCELAEKEGRSTREARAPDPATAGDLTRRSERRALGQSIRSEEDGALHKDISVGGVWGPGKQLSVGSPTVRGFQKDKKEKKKKKKTAEDKTVGCKTLREPDIWPDTESKGCTAHRPQRRLPVYLISCCAGKAEKLKNTEADSNSCPGLQTE